jgi:hypothetical protein
MDCERVREEFVERLTGSLDAERSRAIDQHLAECAACSAEAERLREIWTELGALRVAEPTGAAERVTRLVEARALTAPRPRVTRARGPLVAASAVALAASLAVGVVLGKRSAASSAGASPNVAVGAPARERYVLLLHGPARRAPASRAEAAADSVAEQAIVAEYRSWAMRLRASGALVMAEKLADDPVTMLTANGASELPHDAPDELGGFFLVQVADSAEAFRIARECPHLKHGGTVQIRRIEPT